MKTHSQPYFSTGIRRALAAFIDLLPFFWLVNTLMRGPIGDQFSFLPISDLPVWLFPVVLFTLPVFLFFTLFFNGLFEGTAGAFTLLGEVSLELIATAGIAAPLLILSEAATGRTPGKLLLRIQVVDDQGRTPHLKQIAIRNFVRIYDLAMTWVLLVPIIFWDVLTRRPLPGWASGAYSFVWSPEGQRWGDQLAGTYVVRGQWTPLRPKSRLSASSRTGDNPKPSSTITDPASAIRLSGRKPNS